MKSDMQVKHETMLRSTVGQGTAPVVEAHAVFVERAEKVVIDKPDKTDFQLVISERERSLCSLIYAKPEGDLTAHIVSVFHELAKLICVQI